MARLRPVWLALAVWGAVHPMYWFVTYMRANDMSVARMIDAWYANASTIGLVWDLTISATTLAVWIVAEAFARRDWRSLVALPVIFLIGLGCALPLYLWLRDRPGRVTRR